MTAIDARPATARPYKGLAHYTEEDAPFFFGREGEEEIVIANLLASRLTLLYGPSGVGKSSLLHAGVATRLRDSGEAAVVVFADWRSDPLDGLRRALRVEAGLEGEPGDASLAETIELCAETLGRDVCLVLDQFEEYFVYHPRDDGAFAVELPRTVRLRDLSGSFLISIREDALARLDRFKGRIPNLFDNYYRVDHLARDAAREAIVQPLEEYARHQPDERRVTIEPELVEAILDQVEAGKVALDAGGAGIANGASSGRTRIETPYFQLVLTRLWNEERRRESPVLRLATLEELGGAEEIVRTHLDGALHHLDAHDRDVAARMFRYLVTPSGTKISHAIPDLASYADASEDEVERVVNLLSSGDARILRPVGERTFEIYHDVLAAAILDWRRRYLLAQEEALRERSRRRKRVAGLAVSVPLVVVALVASAAAWLHQADKATDATQAARLRASALQFPFTRQVFLGHAEPVTGVVFDTHGKRVLTASRDGTARVWAVRTGAENARFDASGALRSAGFGRGGVIVAGGDAGAVVWTDGTATQPSVPGSLVFAGLTADGKRLIAGSSSGEITVLDLENGRKILEFSTKDGRLRSAKLDPSGLLIATASENGYVRVYRLGSSAVRIRTLLGSDPGPANDVALSRAGQLVATGGADGTARVSPAPGVARGAALRGRVAVRSIALAPDGSLVAVGRDDGTVQIWSWRTNSVLSTLRGHEGAVLGVAFSPDGQNVATAGDDHTARLWHVARPDLVVRILRTHISGSRMSVDAQVENAGDARSTPTTLGIAVDGATATGRPVPALAPHQSVTRTGVLAIQGRLGVGLARVNASQKIPDSNHANDTAPIVADASDLTVETLGIDQLGGQIVVTTLVTNAGFGPAPATVLQVTIPTTGQQVSVPITGLAPSAERRLEVGIPIPASAQGSTVRAYVTVDPKHTLDEIDEGNNHDQTAPMKIGSSGILVS